MHFASLKAEINRALQTPDLQAALAQRGVDVRGGTAGEFGAFLTNERSKWARAVKDSGATVD
jgi:tripartite-type tricarboxylate transporter receptor subunit TctC